MSTALSALARGLWPSHREAKGFGNLCGQHFPTLTRLQAGPTREKPHPSSARLPSRGCCSPARSWADGGFLCWAPATLHSHLPHNSLLAFAQAQAQAQSPPWPHTACRAVPVLLRDALEPGPLAHSGGTPSLLTPRPALEEAVSPDRRCEDRLGDTGAPLIGPSLSCSFHSELRVPGVPASSLGRPSKAAFCGGAGGRGLGPPL